MTNVVTVFPELVNYIRSEGINHSEFKGFLSDMESKQVRRFYYTVFFFFFCLCRGQMLQCVYHLMSETELFLEIKGKPFPWLHDPYWMCDTAFCIDITQHMKELNTNL
jgi:hypothetical protein